ncbi:unnamed protein product [Linum tenue]|uniref:Putative zinc-finger domain-containing protein n=1 Tax=Linum tenue TaxID=586396 RepID=A0AAV0MA02_9ROSI|nr:unnamed protein product [Linum tenue]
MEVGGAELENLTELPVASNLPEPSTNPNSSEQLAAAVRREDGELSSSSDDDENCSSRLLESSGTDVPSEAGGLCLVEPTKTSMLCVPSENGTRTTSPVNSVDFTNHTSVGANNDKSFGKNSISGRSSSSGWQPASAGDNNLVIRFSDEDTGSESDDKSQKKNLGSTRRNGTDGNGMVIPPSSMPKKLQHAGNNVRNIIPRKPSLSRTFVSSASKINRVNSSRTWTAQAEQTSRVRNFSNGNRNTVTQANTFGLGLGSNQAKLHDLRQQIALREQELKLKSAQQNKQSALVSVKANIYKNQSRNASRKSNTMCSDGAPKEPDRKRQKLNGSFPSQLKADHHVNLPPKPVQTSSAQTAGREQENMVNIENTGNPKRTTASDAVKSLEQDNHLGHKTSSANPASGLYGSERIMANRSSNSTPNRMASETVKALGQDNHLPHITSSANPASTSIDDGHVRPNQIGIQRNIEGDHMHMVHKYPGPSKKVMSEQHLFSSQGTSGGRIISPPVENILQSSLNNARFSSYSRVVDVSQNSDKDLRPLVEMEETLDRELEEAQELRHRCEIEERNALKAYRRAQRALIEANVRCTELYRKRELYSARFRSLIMKDSSLLWSTGDHGYSGMDLSSVEHACKNIQLIPTSIQQQQLCDGQNLRSEPCSDPDVSMSEPLHHGFNNAATRGSSPLDDPIVSTDEDEEVFTSKHDTILNRNIQPVAHNSSEQLKDSDHPQDKDFSMKDSQDSINLEASLRSELFARLGMKAFPKNTVSSCLESAGELGTENDDASERTQMSDSNLPVLATEEHQECDLEGKDNAERSISKAPAQDTNVDKSSHSTADSGRIGYPTRGHQLTPAMLSAPTVLRSVFGHLKVISPTACLAVKCTDNQNRYTVDKYAGDNDNAGSMLVQYDNVTATSMEESNKDVYAMEIGSFNTIDRYAGDNDKGDSMVVQYGNVTANSMDESTKDVYAMEIGSFNSNATIDPFWPLCMYELRGKCNNSECPLQHVADFSAGNKNQHVGSHDSGCSPEVQIARTAAKPSNLGGILELPTYLVGLDIMKAHTKKYESIVAWKDGKCWQKAFSACLALSSLLVKDLPANELFLSGNDGRIEVHGSSITQLSCFHSRNSQVNQAIPSSIHALETSLLTLCQEVNKVENMKKALSILSRAIESDPASETSWIIYLLVYYSNIKSLEKDDMFASAVEFNPASYGLRLMYINSRVHLNERLAAYIEAIRALCPKVFASENGEEMHSSCILDLFLQMLDCLCMSGNVNRAVQTIYGLFGLAAYSDEPNSLLLSDILTCLTISDKYVFWICCVYLVIYRKLPITVLQQFECPKDLPAIQWSPVDLGDDEKDRAVELVERATDSLKLLSYSESPGSEASQRVARNFALSHIGCLMALGRLEFCWSLLETYLDMHPEFLELLLVSARSQATDFECSTLDGFENALTNWPKEAPGIVGLWNQYIQVALERRGPDLAKQLLVRWFNSISEVTSTDSNHSVESLASVSVSSSEFSVPYSNRMDIMFGYLNLSLAKLLQNDHIEARAAIDRAFKSAVPAYFNHCLVEHAAFLLNHRQHRQTKEDTSPISERLRILRGYLDDARDLFIPKPLSREFIKTVEKPRVQQLISNILSPVSSEFLLVNLVLEVWHGPSLLPQWDSIINVKELVDLVEAILEMVPSNYPLALSVCRMLKEGSLDGTSSRSLLFWSSSTLIQSIFQAIPVAPECVWVEAAQVLAETEGADLLSERFYKRALSVYPFSKKLWCRYKEVAKGRTGRGSTSGAVEEEARKRGIEVE